MPRIKSLILVSLMLLSKSAATQNFWVPTNGPDGGSVFTIFPAEDGRLYAGTDNGAFVSSDQGQTWHQTSLASGYVWAFAESRTGNLFAAVTGGVYRSTDGGLTWTRVLSIPVAIDALLVTPANILFAASHISDNPGHFTLVYRSLDNGASWEPVGRCETGLCASGVSSLVMSSSGQIFAGTWSEIADEYAGLYVSEDSGATWSQTNLRGRNVHTLLIDSSDVLFAATQGRILQSLNGGETWNTVGDTLPDVMFASLVFDSTGRLFAGTLNHGVLRLDGNTWTPVNDGLLTLGTVSVATTPGGHLFAASSQYGVFRSKDASAHWILSNTGLTITHVSALTVHPGGGVIAGTAGQGLFYLPASAEMWSQSEQKTSEVTSLLVDRDGVVFAGLFVYDLTSRMAKWDVLRSFDAGRSWQGTGLNVVGINTLAAYADTALLAGTFDGVYRSPDKGDTWTHIGLSGHVVRSLAVNARGDIFAVATHNYSLAVFRYTHDSRTWERTSLTDIYATSIAIHPDGDIFVGTVYDGGLFRSTDNGDTWKQTGLNDSSIYIPAIVFDEAGKIYVGTNKGVFQSEDHGDSWLNISTGLTKSVRSLAIGTQGFLFAGTNGAGVFRSLDQVVSVTQKTLQTPDTFVLHQNFPNPFNPATQIQYDLTADVPVTLTIYNLLGQKIKTLVHETQKAGSYTVAWDGTDERGNKVPGGVYLYRLQAGHLSGVKKMVVIR